MRSLTILTTTALGLLGVAGTAAAQDPAESDPRFAVVEPSPFETLQRRKWGHPVIADLDQDGYRDIITIDHGWAVRVYWNDAGTYSAPYDVVMGDIHGIAVSDYNDDGLLEAVISRGGGSGSNPRNSKIYRFGRDRSITLLPEIDPPLRGMRGRTHKWFDGDQDGDLDLLQFGFPNRERAPEGEHDILRNEGGGQLAHDNRLPPSNAGNFEPALVTDANGDGDPDLLRFGSRPAELFLGSTGLGFTLAGGAIPGHYDDVTSAVEFDYDNDGDMDLYLARGNLPGQFETFYDEENERLGFYLSRGTHELPLLDLGNTLRMRTYQAQYPDHRVWVGETAYEWRRESLGDRDWHAATDITFNSADALGFPDERTERGLHFGYVGNRQWKLVFDTFPGVSGVIEGVSEFTESEHIEELPDVLLRNDGGRFTDVTRESGLFRRGHSMGVAAGDFDNDGLIDLFVTNRGKPVTPQSHSLWMNRGEGRFEEVLLDTLATKDLGAFGWGAEALDFDNDGRLDVLFGNERGRWHLRRNVSEQSRENAALTVIVPTAPEAGTSAMGALVTLEGCGRRQLRRVGSSGAPYSQGFDTSLHFGVGTCDEVHTATIRWANGEIRSFNAAPSVAKGEDGWVREAYFQNRVFDDSPTQLYPDRAYADGVTDDTQRVQAALDAASAEDADGGVVVLNRARRGGESTYRLGVVYVPSNVRIEIDPAVTLVQSADPEPRPGHPAPIEVGTFDRNRYMFAVGVTPTYWPDGRHRPQASVERVENVEIRSTVPGERFTVDLAREYPVEYWFRPSTFSRPQEPTEVREDGQNEVYAAPFVFAFARNFRLSDVDVIDNYTVLPSVHLYADTDGQFGSLRHQGQPGTDPSGEPLENNDLIHTDGTKLRNDQPIVVNETWGRTPSNGVVENMTTINSHTGYGLLQVYGGENVYMRDLHGEGGITVRLEPGSGTDRMNAAGPFHSRIANIEIEDISNRNGFTTLWFNPHGKFNTNIRAHNVAAIDSGSALLILKSTIDESRRDYTRGRFHNVQLSGDVVLERSHDEPTAEIGFYSTYFIHPDLIAEVVDRTGNDENGHATLQPDGEISPFDMANPVPGRRWFLTEAIAPVLAMNQLATDNIGRVDEDGDGVPDLALDRHDFYPIGFSQVNIIRRGAIRRPEDILYREDMRNFSNGRAPRRNINE